MLKRLLVGAVVLLAAAKPALAAYGGQGVNQGGTTTGQTGDLLFCAVVSTSPSYTAGTTQPCNLNLSGALKVDGTVAVTSLPAPPDILTLGLTLDATGASGPLTIPIASGMHTVSLSLAGLTGSGATIRLENSASTTVIYPRFDRATGQALGGAMTTDAPGYSAVFNVAGAVSVRLRVVTAGSGSITVNSDASYGLFPFDYANGPTAPGSAALTSKLIGGIYKATPPTLTDGQQAAALLDTLGAAKVTESANNLATSQATASTTASVICAARAGRRAATIQNLGTTQVFYGASGVTTTTGGLIPGTAGSAITVNTSAAIYGITSTGSQAVACTETY